MKPFSVIAGNELKLKTFSGSLAKDSRLKSVVRKFAGHRDK